MMKPAWNVSMKRLCTDSDRSSLAMSTAWASIPQPLGMYFVLAYLMHLQEPVHLLAYLWHLYIVNRAQLQSWILAIPAHKC